jgi:hypothetical protein
MVDVNGSYWIPSISSLTYMAFLKELSGLLNVPVRNIKCHFFRFLPQSSGFALVVRGVKKVKPSK